CGRSLRASESHARDPSTPERSVITRTCDAEDLGEVEAHGLLELLERARARIAVGAPPDELARVPEPVPLHVVVPDLDDALGAQRDEGQVLLGVPTAALGAPWGTRLGHLLLPGPRAPGARRHPRVSPSAR